MWETRSCFVFQKLFVRRSVVDHVRSFSSNDRPEKSAVSVPELGGSVIVVSSSVGSDVHLTWYTCKPEHTPRLRPFYELLLILVQRYEGLARFARLEIKEVSLRTGEIHISLEPGRITQYTSRLTRQPVFLGSIRGPAIYFRRDWLFLFCRFNKGNSQLLVKDCALSICERWGSLSLARIVCLAYRTVLTWQ